MIGSGERFCAKSPRGKCDKFHMGLRTVKTEQPIFEPGQRVKLAGDMAHRAEFSSLKIGVVLYMLRDYLGHPVEWVAVRWNDRFTCEHHADDLELIDGDARTSSIARIK